MIIFSQVQVGISRISTQSLLLGAFAAFQSWLGQKNCPPAVFLPVYSASPFLLCVEEKYWTTVAPALKYFLFWKKGWQSGYSWKDNLLIVCNVLKLNGLYL